MIKPISPLIIILILYVLAGSLFAQNPKGKTSEDKEEKAMLNPDQKAVPKGGYDEFLRILGANIKPPMDFAESQVKMVIQVTVEKNGRLSGIKFIKGADFRIEDEVKRLLSDSRWTPAEHQGVKVRHQLTFPLNFKLQ